MGERVKSFPLEKILGCYVSPSDYCISEEKDLSNYELRGVHFEIKETNNLFKSGKRLIDLFAEVVPMEAEIVVGYHTAGAISYGQTNGLENNYWTSELKIATGTALIPKKK